MHVDAFYEYLLCNPHPYWTEIPTTPNPVSEGVRRDGVAAEDDMALRSLLSYIRPRRGRKRPEEGRNNVNSQSQSMQRTNDRFTAETCSTGGGGGGRGASTEQLDLWATTPDAHADDLLFASQDRFSRMPMDMDVPQSSTGGASPWGFQDDFVAQTPLSTCSYSSAASAGNPTSAPPPLWPFEQQMTEKTHQSAGTPPFSSNTAQSPTLGNKQSKRHGAKVVSSAWRAGGPGGSGKTRGRPPIKRKNNTIQSHSHGQSSRSLSGEISPFMSAFGSSSPPSSLGQNTSQMASLSVVPIAIMTLGSDDNVSSAKTITSAAVSAPSDLAMQDEVQMRQYNQHDRDSQHSEYSLQVPQENRYMGSQTGTSSPFLQHQGQKSPMAMVDESLTLGQPASHMFAPHGLAVPEVQMMDSFPRVHDQQHPAHIEHDLQHLQQTVPQDFRGHSLYSELDMIEASLCSQQHGKHYSTVPSTSHNQHIPVAGITTSGDDAVAYQDLTDRTNLDAIESLLAHSLLTASWHDQTTNLSISACDIDEAVAIACALVYAVRKGATSHETFVSNMATLAGTTFLKGEEPLVRVYRVGQARQGEENVEEKDFRVYDIHWDLRLGDIRGGFHLKQSVNLKQWMDKKTSNKKARAEDDERDAEGEDEEQQQHTNRPDQSETNASDIDLGSQDGFSEATMRFWRERYKALLSVVEKQNTELQDLRRGIFGSSSPIIIGSGGGNSGSRRLRRRDIRR